MNQGRKLTFRRQQQANPEHQDPEEVKEMYEKIVKRNNPTGLMHLQDKFIDTSPISQYDMQCIAQQAMKDRKWQSVQRGSIIQTIKGKPYCLKLGSLKPDSDNFLGFFQTFYSYVYQDQLTKPLIKPSPVSYNPLSKNAVSQRSTPTRSASRSSRRKTVMSSRQASNSLPPPLPKFHSIDLNSKKRPTFRNRSNKSNRQKTSKTTPFEPESHLLRRRLLQQKSAFDCSRLIDNCDKFLSEKFKPKMNLLARKSSVSSQIYA